MGVKVIEIWYKRRELKESARRGACKIVIGSSGVTQAGWIATEKDQLDLLKAADWERYFRDNPIDALLAEHVWEHLSGEEGLIAARHCFRYLKPGGYIRVAVPDRCHPDKEYLEWVRPGGSGPGCDDHKMFYSYQTLTKVFGSAGFQMDLLEYFDEQGVFHFKEWDPRDGRIGRSKRFDSRNQDGKLKYTSIIMDARKPVQA